MKKFIEFMKFINTKTNGKFFWFSYFICNTLMLIALSMEGVVAVNSTSKYAFMKLFAFFINNLLLSVYIAVLVLLIYVFIRICLWIYKELIPSFKEAMKEIYGFKTKNEIIDELKKEKETKEAIDKLKEIGLTEGDWKR